MTQINWSILHVSVQTCQVHGLKSEMLVIWGCLKAKCGGGRGTYRAAKLPYLLHAWRVGLMWAIPIEGRMGYTCMKDEYLLCPDGSPSTTPWGHQTEAPLLPLCWSGDCCHRCTSDWSVGYCWCTHSVETDFIHYMHDGIVDVHVRACIIHSLGELYMYMYVHGL